MLATPRPAAPPSWTPARCYARIAAVYENRVRLIPLQARYRMQQQIGVVFLKSRERDPNLLALVAECRMYAKRHEG